VICRLGIELISLMDEQSHNEPLRVVWVWNPSERGGERDGLRPPCRLSAAGEEFVHGCASTWPDVTRFGRSSVIVRIQ